MEVEGGADEPSQHKHFEMETQKPGRALSLRHNIPIIIIVTALFN